MRAAVFLDRDGVLNERRLLLVRTPAQFRFRHDALEAVARLAKLDVAIVVATNQPAVGWGFMARTTLDAIHSRMIAEIEGAGGRIDAVQVCAYARGEDPPCRKPRPGMLLAAAESLGLDLSRSWMVGDTRKDLLAGRAAGCRTALVNPSFPARVRGARRLADVVASNLSGAVAAIEASVLARA